MPATNVNYPFPLTRLNPWYPGQFGVHGAWTETGLRTSPEGTVFYVDPQHADANDGRDGTDPTAPLATVTAALARCQDDVDDVILISSTVSEDVTCTVDGVRFLGIQHGTLGVPWLPATSGGTALIMGGQDCLVEGFLFYARGTSIGVDIRYGPSPTFCDYDVVRYCHFEDHAAAIILDYAYYIAIHGCTFTDCMFGIWGQDNGEWWPMIYDNTFHDCGDSTNAGAIWMPGVDSAVIHNNRLYHADGAGGNAATDVYINLDGGISNLVSQNVLACLLGAGPGGYDDTCSPGVGDAWVHNYCMNGPTVGNPA